jgi:hypothetical protein
MRGWLAEGLIIVIAVAALVVAMRLEQFVCQ